MRIIVVLLAGSCFLMAESNPLTQAVTARYNTMKQNLTQAAEVMPEENYTYKLSPEQRPYSAWVEHTAMGNYSYCSAIQGKPAPEMGKHGATGKAELQKALKDSFDYCDAAFSGLTDQKALAEAGGKAPVTAMVGLIASLNEHYGNMVGYLRTKGITPPSTARAKK